VLIHPYRLINLIFAGIILAIFLYSGIFNPDRGNHPIPSAHYQITGEVSSSTGLSRGFSAVIRFQFNKARNFNVYSVRLFVFFVIQLLMRSFFFFFYPVMVKIGVQRVVIADSIISGGLFILFFEPFWRELFQIFR
jgi:hypothetical protein